MTRKRKRIATVTHPSVTAALDGLYRYSDKAKAQETLATLKKHFVISRKQPEQEDALRLWVKGYQLTPDLRKKGFRGHFVLIRVAQQDDRWTLHAEIDPVPLKEHPQRERPKRPHPDWGHPLLREIKKEKEYATAGEAAEILMALHEAFPDASIPGHGKLYLMVYERMRDPARPVNKYIFKAIPVDEAHEEGPWKIQYILNPKRTRLPKRRKLKPEHAVEGATPGFFAKMVQKKRK